MWELRGIITLKGRCMQNWPKQVVCGVAALLTLCAFSLAQGEEDALNPRYQGDWNYDNAPMPTHLGNCSTAMTLCQLPRRTVSKKESDVNQAALSGDRLGTPAPALPPTKDALFGPKIGTMSSLNESSARSGPAIKTRR